MKRYSRISFLLSLALLAFATGSTRLADDDAKAVQGTWLPTKAELSGKPMPVAVLKTIPLKLDNGNYVAYVGDEPDKGTYTLDTNSNPMSMTITGTEGPNSGRTFPAIYELRRDEHKGDTLVICYDLSGAKRPAEFKNSRRHQAIPCDLQPEEGLMRPTFCAAGECPIVSRNSALAISPSV